MRDDDANQEIRLDKWLWAARFFKTRSLTAEAITGGKVEINGERAKPSRIVRLGDRLNIRRGPYEWTIIDVILLKKSFPKIRKKYFAHRWSISHDRSLVNHFLHPEFL